ncbi:hypothetical protein RND71_009635 [Anisodus tanguticus]|uniref:Uncharacterized protein n=1 Tax=Anisodus tanguticus TaxID=243964 RepID=A0AAE1SI58_9SOLA|nr:hypothetical protein RND71_009635 [Anisodus tanguticus]
MSISPKFTNTKDYSPMSTSPANSNKVYKHYTSFNDLKPVEEDCTQAMILLGSDKPLQDILDIVGNKIFGIQSFTVHLGQEKVLWICIALLEMAYLVAIVVGATSSNIWSKYFTVLGHAALALLL